MLAGNTDRVSKRTTVLMSGLLVVVAGGAVWFGADFLRDRRLLTNVAAQGQAVREPAASAGSDAAAPAAEGGPANARSAPQPGSLTTADPATGATMDTTLILAGGGVLVSYPAGFDLAVTQEQLLVSSQIPPCDQGFDYCVYLDPAEFAGTNFSSAGLRIDVRDDLGNEAACVLEQPSGYSDLVPIVAGAADFATTMFHGVDQGAAGHFSQGSLGRLYYDSTCYEFESRVAQAQFGNFPRGAVEEFDAADRSTTEERLIGVLDSVSLPDGRAGLWARKVPIEPAVTGPGSRDSDAAAAGTDGALGAVADQHHVVAVAEPAANGSVTSPVRVVGMAPGAWFFEASFPYQLVGPDGAVLSSGAVTAQSDWMTEALVGFEASIEFEVASDTDAVLVLMKDNPSALPENDASFELPLHLLP